MSQAPFEPLRILHCFRSPVGGIFRHVRDLAEYHSKAGHHVGILCDSTTGGSLEDSYFDSIRPFLSLGLTRTPIQRSVGVSDFKMIINTYKEVKSLQPDVIHGHGAKGGALARIIGSALRVNKYRVARFYSPHGGSLHYEKSSLKGRAVILLERLLEIGTDSLVFVSRQESEVYQSKFGKPYKPFAMIYNGIGDSEFERVPLKPDAVDFLYIGMMRDLKGPDIFIEAFAEAERRVGRPLSAVMVGDGPDVAKYEDMILKKGLTRRITMLPGMKPRVAFSFSPTVVVPSRAEAMPYIVIEALGAGRHVIASRVGGIPEVLGDQSPALAIPGDAKDLARIMAESLVTADWADQVMPRHDMLKAAFSSRHMAEQMLDLYQNTLALEHASVSVS